MRKLFSFFIVLASIVCNQANAAKSLYIPAEWKSFNSNDTLLYSETDTNNKYTWSKTRSRETDNCIVYWDKYYGNTAPDGLKSSDTYYVDINDLLKKAEAFYQLESSTLGFVDPVTSNISKYKIMILVNHSSGWICYGGGYDFQISALWLSPSTCKPVGEAVAHEIGHSFHYMCYSEASKHGTLSNVQTGFHGAVGNGSVTWEQTAQWQAMQSYPELMYSQSIDVFRNAHNYAMTHEWQRYQSYWFFYYLCQHYGDIKTVANVWNHSETSVKDFNEVLMDLKGLKAADLYKLYFDYACRLTTWDLDVCKPYRDGYIGDFTYRCAMLPDNSYQVALASCPQRTGFNVIPLSVPEAGTKISTDFTALKNASALAAGDPAEYLNGSSVYTAAKVTKYYSTTYAARRGFRLGYVALMTDGTRQYFNTDSIYCTGIDEKAANIGMTVPEGVSKLWLVVSPALSAYIEHKWDESMSADDQWPYRVKFSGTDIGSSATVYVEPTIDGRSISNATFDYDVYFPATTSSSGDYSGTTLTVGGNALAVLGTAFQMKPSAISGLMQTYKAGGPDNGKIMFYAANADSTLISSGSTANGYGHWFNAQGGVASWPNGYVYSEFNASSISFSLGQQPGKMQNGNTYTIRQALKYKKSDNENATALFIFNIHASDSQTGVKLSHVDYQGITSGIEVHGIDPHGNVTVYDIQGRKINTANHAGDVLSGLARGIYIVNGKKYLKK